MSEQPEPKCPKCGSVEWFPGSACFHCGWEGSAADAYALVSARLAERDREIEELEDANQILREKYEKNWGNDCRRITDLEEEIEDWKETHRRVLADAGSPDEVHCSCCSHLRVRVGALERALERMLSALGLDYDGERFVLKEVQGE